MARRKRLVIPEQATLRGRRYRIYKRRNEQQMDPHDVGLCEVEDPPFFIRLDPDQEPGELDATWCHELLHAIWPKNVVSSEVEEKLIRGLEYRLRDAVARGYLRAEP